MCKWYEDEQDRKLVAAHFTGKAIEWDKNSDLSDVKRRIRSTLLKKSDYTCCYCMCMLPYVNFPIAVEHIVPKEKYPQFTYTFENLAVACDRCNSHKLNQEIFAHPDSSKEVYPNDKDEYIIIHPYFDNYAKHIFIDKDIFFTKLSPKGARTIEMLKLYDFELALSRAKMLSSESEKVSIARDACKQRSLNSMNSLFEKFQSIIAMGGDDSKYNCDLESIRKICQEDEANFYRVEGKNDAEVIAIKNSLEKLNNETKIKVLLDKFHEYSLYDDMLILNSSDTSKVIDFIDYISTVRVIDEAHLTIWRPYVDFISKCLIIGEEIKCKYSICLLLNSIDLSEDKYGESIRYLPYINAVNYLKILVSKLRTLSSYKRIKLSRCLVAIQKGTDIAVDGD